jgi:putative tryptophan/tyrosine transport system substrate-binding protein
MDRRRFLMTSLAGALLPWSVAEAQQPGKVYRVGLLSWGPPLSAAGAFTDEMRVLGYVEGRNLTMEYRWVVAFDRLPEEATRLVQAPLDAIVVVSTPAALAAKNATRTIPVVMAASADPVGAGVVDSLARPGGNITGLALMNPDLTGKRIEVLNQIVPHLTWIAAVHRGPSDFPIVAHWLNENQEAARRFGLRVLDVSLASEPEAWERGFLTIPKRPGTAATILEDPALVAENQLVASLLMKSRLPAVFPFREHVNGGGLVSYGVNLPQLVRSAARYVDRILRGARPADIPIEQPTRFELIVNLKTAKALGLTIPPSLLAQADQVIE